MKGFGANHFGCESEGSRYSFLRKMGVRPEKVISRSAMCQVFKDHFDGNARSLDDGTTTANSGIGMDKRFPLHELNIPWRLRSPDCGGRLRLVALVKKQEMIQAVRTALHFSPGSPTRRSNPGSECLSLVIRE